MKTLGVDLGSRLAKLALTDSETSTVRVMTVPLSLSDLRILGLTERGDPNSSSTGQSIEKILGLIHLPIARLVEDDGPDIITVGGSYRGGDLVNVTPEDSVINRINITREIFSHIVKKPYKMYVVSENLNLQEVPASVDDPFSLFSEGVNSYTLTHDCGSAYIAAKLNQNAILVEMGTTSTKVVPIINGNIPKLSGFGLNPNILDLGLLSTVSSLSLNAFFREYSPAPIRTPLTVFEVIRFLSRYHHSIEAAFESVNKAISHYDSLSHMKIQNYVLGHKASANKRDSSPFTSLWIDSRGLKEHDLKVMYEYILDEIELRVRKLLLTSLLRYDFGSFPLVILEGAGEEFLKLCIDPLDYKVLRVSDAYGDSFSSFSSPIGLAALTLEQEGIPVSLDKLKVDRVDIIKQV